jgi:general secretion pathway protein F
MAAFTYRAVDAAGKAQKGVVEAASAAGARRLLRERALLPVSVEASNDRDAPAAAGAAPAFRLPWLRRRIGQRTLATATRQLSTLIGSDIRIEEALRLVAEQAESQKMRSLLLDLRGNILDGRSFAGALSTQPQAFPEYYRASIAAGEQSGRLGDVLSHLADFVEGRSQAQNKLTLALLYPALLAVVSIGMIVMLMVYVVPDIVRVFQQHGADLPFLTRALIGLSGFVRGFGLVILALLVIGGVAFGRWIRVPANRMSADRMLATRQPFARFSKQVSAARFAGTLAQLVQSSVPLVDALAAAAAVTPNRHIRTRALLATERVREGASLHAAMAEAGVFPAMLLAIVASGESSGRLGPALARASTELERELDQFVTLLVSLVEPAVLLFMGGIVMLLVLAILLPIVNLNNLVTT